MNESKMEINGRLEVFQKLEKDQRLAFWGCYCFDLWRQGLYS